MKSEMDNSEATLEWLSSKRKRTAREYRDRFEIWLEYCRIKGIPSTGRHEKAKTQQ